MKRNLIAILMCLVMVCCGVCAQAEATAPDLTGVWTLDSIVAGEMTISPSMMGLTMTLTVNADGTIVLDSNGEQEQSTWTQDGDKLIVDGDAFTYVDGKLTAEEPSMGAVMYFVRGDAAAPVLLTDVTLADFNGAWNAVSVEIMGMEMPMAMIGSSIAVEINDTQAKATFSETAEDGTVESFGAAGTCGLANGVLTVVIPDEVEDFTMQLQLRSDDKMVFAVEEEGMAMNILFEKVAE